MVRRFARQHVQFLSGDQMGRGQAVACFSSVNLTEAVLARWRVDSQIETTLLRFFYQYESIRFVVRKALSQWIGSSRCGSRMGRMSG